MLGHREARAVLGRRAPRHLAGRAGARGVVDARLGQRRVRAGVRYDLAVLDVDADDRRPGGRRVTRRRARCGLAADVGHRELRSPIPCRSPSAQADTPPVT